MHVVNESLDFVGAVVAEALGCVSQQTWALEMPPWLPGASRGSRTIQVAVTVMVDLDSYSELKEEQVAEAIAERVTAFLYPVGMTVRDAVAGVVSDREISF